MSGRERIPDETDHDGQRQAAILTLPASDRRVVGKIFCKSGVESSRPLERIRHIEVFAAEVPVHECGSVVRAPFHQTHDDRSPESIRTDVFRRHTRCRCPGQLDESVDRIAFRKPSRYRPYDILHELPNTAIEPGLIGHRKDERVISRSRQSAESNEVDAVDERVVVVQLRVYRKSNRDLADRRRSQIGMAADRYSPVTTRGDMRRDTLLRRGKRIHLAIEPYSISTINHFFDGKSDVRNA